MEIAKKVYSVDKRFRSSSSNLDFHKPLPSSSSALEDPFSMEKVKIISKGFANRLKVVLPEVIWSYQNTFIKGRQILDSVLIANEEYIEEDMECMGSGSRFRAWIRLSVLVNWHPTEDFAMEKGLRQEDSLSPFVFTIAAERFSKMLERGCSMGLTEGISHGLKVNFFKSSISRFGMEKEVIYSTAFNLRCKMEDLPLKYLGLPIGESSSGVTA
ncbi:hypothetical protein OIU77_009673 [Salix suchowensis]|uniref:Reverse transcriptase domain-containing protein n=1 Tax=Salix suchowensis TaxID=1278906 RepID=A0ABQ9AFR9_9ROSI|nr:hypothetical protein OIU77_009673 [Salix suchowensis]